MYAAVQLDTLLDRMATDLPGAGLADKRWALGRAYRELVSRSRCWRERIEIEAVPAGTVGVPLVPASLEGLGYAHQVLRIQADAWDMSRAGNWSLLPYEDGQSFLRFSPPPLPQGPGGEGGNFDLGVEMVVWPLSSASAGPDFILGRYGEGIAARARGILKGQSGKPWSERDGAAWEERDFRRMLSDACYAAQQPGAPLAAETVIVLPDASAWAVPDEDGVRDLSDPAALTLGEFMQAFRTLVRDLQQKGVV